MLHILQNGMKSLLFLIPPFFALGIYGQNTVGLISIDPAKTIGGYNLIYPENQSNVFLLNECGEIVHQWGDTNGARPGKTAYLLENGNLLKCKFDQSLTGVSFGAGGAGGMLEIRSWDNELIWSYMAADSLIRQHHDVHYMPNGNILFIAWERISLGEMLENGFDSLANSQREYWPDLIREVNPTTNEVVWEWRAWDHLVQDFDPSKANYGIIGDHPELIDINYNQYSGFREDWMHSNAIDYDPVKDQIILSVRNFSEIWIIDHSTTTEQAASHAGGNSGRGGDLIFRWGNIEAYKKGQKEDRQLFSQHDAHWIDDYVEPAYQHHGKIAVFNNFIDNSYSRGQILAPVWDATTYTYVRENGIYLPSGFAQTFSHPDPGKTYSGTASSIQVMGDGHIIMCAAQQGFIFELAPGGEVVWEYKTPLKNGFSIPQGFILGVNDNFTFQCKRYPGAYSAFIGKDLSPKGYIELSPNTSFCLFTGINEDKGMETVKIYPNPAAGHLFIEGHIDSMGKLEIFNQYGQVVYYEENMSDKAEVDISSWPQGVYFVKIGSRSVRKITLTN